MQFTNRVLTRYFSASLFLFFPGLLCAEQSSLNNQIENNSSELTYQGADLRFPANFFPILPWDWFDNSNGANMNNGLASMAECNFTMSIFIKPELLPESEKLGLMSIVGSFGEENGIRTNSLTDDQIDSKVKELVEKSKNSTALLGYHIIDEPGASCFPTLAKIVKAFRKYDPGKLAFINLYPNYGTVGAKNNSQLEAATYMDYLEQYVSIVNPQILCYDNYTVQCSNDLEVKGVATSYFNNLMEVREIALKYNIPFWNIVSSNQIRLNVAAIPSPANISLQAYTTLAAGAKGIGWWTYYSRGEKRYTPVDKFDPNENAFVSHSDRKTLTWRYMQEINRQVSVLGPILLPLKSTAVYFTNDMGIEYTPGKLVRSIRSTSPLMIGEFESNERQHYAMIVNLSLQKSAKFFLDAQSTDTKIEIVSAEDATLRRFDVKEGEWLVAGQGVLIHLDSNKQ
ncbi:MAG: hypothetical protein A2Y12_03590 [Planctomycetes bacterium GWF2_42_9]|nr:MAG: hypothetical protein A2Y12_03590 [Planctomycetes bacterium GWF2_42_9]